MSEIVTIAAEDRATADAQLELEKTNRPDAQARVERRGFFELGQFNLVPGPKVRGRGGGAEKTDGTRIYLIVVEFS